MADDSVRAEKSHKMALDKGKAVLLGFTLTSVPFKILAHKAEFIL